MRFPRNMLESKDKMEDKSSSADDTEMQGENSDIRRRKSSVFGRPKMFLIHHNGHRKMSGESMSCSSQDSEDVIPPVSMQIKRLSSETGSVSMASTSSASSSTSSPVCLDELDELLLAIHGQLVESEALRSDIVAYEDGYRESKALVRQMAQELVMKIRAHEARLLEEIEARRETMYKKLGLGHGRDKLDKLIKQMEKTHAEGEAIMSESAQTCQSPELSPNYNAVVDKLREELEEAENMPSADVKVFPIYLSPVRCNTAFACLEDQHLNGATGGHGHLNGLSVCHNRRKSMPHSPYKPSSCSRGRNNSLQASSSFGSNMHQLVVIPQEANRGSQSPSTGREPIERRVSVMQHSAFSSNHMWNRSESTSSSQTPDCLSESYEDSSTQLLWELSTEGALQGQINCPNDIAFLPNGHLVVSDRDNYRLQVFDAEGKSVSIIAEGKIKPRRIAVTRDGHIAVTDSKDNMVKVFDTQGNLVSSWGKKRFKQMFKSPCAIACTHKGQFVISDMERHTVTMHSSDGKLLRHLGGENGGSTEFHSPSYISVNPRNNDIIVADNWTHSVKVFDEHGNFKLHAESNDDLKYPNGIACGAEGNFFVALWGSHTLTEFSATGKYTETVLNRAGNSIYHPAGVAVHGNMLAISEYSDTHSALRFYALNNTSSSG